ncbi:MAG: flagellar hook-associated protein FlgK [Pseudomonadota bacterium]
MSITNALNNALSGLSATGRLADVTAGNLANALTPGYGKQSVILSSRVTGTQGAGVQVTGVERALDPELTAARRLADGNLAERNAAFEALTSLERSIGQVGDPTSLYTRLSEFEQALRQLGETPESAARQDAAATTARDLADTFNSIGRETTELRAQTDIDIGRAVNTLNTSLENVARLNRQIQLAQAGGRNTAPLIDKRESEIDQIAQILPIRQSPRSDGVVEIYTREGLNLVDIRAQKVEYTVTPVYEPGLTYGSPPLSGLTLRDRDITPGGGGSQAVRGGLLAGLFDVRDRITPEIESQVDSLAADLAVRLADPAVDPTLAATDPGLFTDLGNAFDLTDTTGFASRINLNAAVDPSEGGDPSLLRDGLQSLVPGPTSNDTIIRAMADALTARNDVTVPPAVPGLTGALSVADRVAAVMELVATDRVVTESEVSGLSTARQTLANEEAEKLGVDTEEELSRLIQIEQAYAANAQVVQTAARMLDELTRLQ